MHAKKWLLIWSLFLFIIPIVGLFNYIIDPMWMFKHSFNYNSLQIGFDERKQKSIFLKIHGNEYDTLLIGSSRTTYYNQNEFKNMKVFNYAFSGGKPYEYIDFISNFKRYNNMKNLVIGFDFFDCKIGYNEDKDNKINENKQLLHLINDTSVFRLYLENYFTIDMFKYSMKNIKRSFTGETNHRSYNRNNIVIVNKVSEEKVIKLATRRSKDYYSDNKMYDSDFLKTLLSINKEKNNANIYVYTTPLSKPFLEVIYNDEKLRTYYFQWIRDLVSGFGRVYFVTYMNDLALNFQNYSVDGDHFYPFIGKEITSYISKEKVINKDFDIADNILIIDNENLEESLKIIKNQMK